MSQPRLLRQNQLSVNRQERKPSRLRRMVSKTKFPSDFFSKTRRMSQSVDRISRRNESSQPKDSQNSNQQSSRINISLSKRVFNRKISFNSINRGAQSVRSSPIVPVQLIHSSSTKLPSLKEKNKSSKGIGHLSSNLNALSNKKNQSSNKTNNSEHFLFHPDDIRANALSYSSLIADQPPQPRMSRAKSIKASFVQSNQALLTINQKNT